jgi:hypothetical protein
MRLLSFRLALAARLKLLTSPLGSPTKGGSARSLVQTGSALRYSTLADVRAMAHEQDL